MLNYIFFIYSQPMLNDLKYSYIVFVSLQLLLSLVICLILFIDLITPEQFCERFSENQQVIENVENPELNENEWNDDMKGS